MQQVVLISHFVAFGEPSFPQKLALLVDFVNELEAELVYFQFF